MTDTSTVVVTGATSGIGHATVSDLAHDHHVIAVGRNEEALAAWASVDAVRAVRLDIADAEARRQFVANLPDALSGIVHCAALGTAGMPAEVDAEEWRRQLDLNVVAAAELTRLSLPRLRTGDGTVVFINSGAGLRASAAMTVYAATKHALRAYADSLRAAEAGKVRVTSIYPGRVDTPMQEALIAYEGGSYTRERFLNPATVAAAVRYALTVPADGHVTDLQLRPRWENA